MLPSIKYFDRGDHVLEVRSVSSTERYTRRLPVGTNATNAPPQPKGPSLVQKARNLARSTREHRRAGSPLASDADVAHRFATCSSNRCGLFTAEGEGAGTCRHESCGCRLRAVGSEDALFPHKLRWADQACPVGLWLPVAPAISEKP